MKRLNTGVRLRIAWLLFGMMFFYGIEQLFLNRFIKNPSARAYLTVAYTAALVAFDIPTGILADRVSRKLCLLLACIVQIIALVILGSSNSLLAYVVGAVVFGVYICLTNGAAQAIQYDWLAQSGRRKDYAKEQGRDYAAFLLGAAVANLASGFMANAFGLRSAYFLSIIPAVIAFVVLIGLVDPPVAKKQATQWYKHLGEVWQEAKTHRKILIYAVRFIAAGVALYTIGEFGQIYMLSFGISAVALGVFWSIDAVFAAGGRALAYRAQNYPRLFILAVCIVFFMFALVERKIGIGLFWLFYGMNEALSNIAETEIQDETSSHIRATMLSSVSFVGNLISIPIILLYNEYYLRHGILAANRLILGALIVILLATLLVRSDRRRVKASAQAPLPPVI